MYRLEESGYLNLAGNKMDSSKLALSIKSVQKSKGLKADGKINATLIKTLNTTDAERFKQIAINIDRYKQLPATMPQNIFL